MADRKIFAPPHNFRPPAVLFLCLPEQSLAHVVIYVAHDVIYLAHDVS